MNICSGICSDCETPLKCIHIFVRPCFRSASVWSRRGGGSRNRRGSWKDSESWRGRERRRDAKRLRGERQAADHETRDVSFVQILIGCFSTKPNCSTRTLSQMSRPPSENWSGSGSWNGSASVGRSF